MPDTIAVADQGDHLLVTLDNPERRNALAPSMHPVLRDALVQAATEDRFGAVVLTGAGGYFCAGGDLNALSHRAAMTRDERRARIDDLHMTIRLKEKGAAEEVVVVSIGVKQAGETLRTALAMGADRAILVVAADDVHQDIEPLAVAKILKAVVDAEQPKLVVAGKQAIDNDMNATEQMLAALLGWGQATCASKVEIEGNAAKVTREVGGGLQTISVALPAIVTADLRLNEPRYASLPNIMKAKKKPLEEKTAADYGVDVTPRLEIGSTREPEGRSAGIKVGSVDELVGKLKEAGVI
jgi:electron transfer flavoprotein beta subunit